MANNRQLPPPPPPPYRPGFPPMQPPKQMQYIGARYVPKFADPVEYNPLTAYEALTIVIYNRDSYTSRQPVPAGIDPTNGEYWVKTGDFNAQLNDLSTKIDGWDEQIAEIETTANNAETIAQKALDEVEATDVSQLTSRVDTLETDMTAAQGDISSIQTDQTAQDAKITALETSQTAQDTKITAAENNISTLQATTASLSTQIGDIKTAADNAQASADAAASDASDAKSAAADAKAAADAVAPEVTALKTTIGDDSSGLVKDVNDVKSDIADLQTEIGDGTGSTSLSSRVSALETSQGTQDTSISANTTAISSLNTTVGNSTSGLVKQVNDLAETVGSSASADSLSGRVDSLETEVGTDDSKGSLFPRVAAVESQVSTNASGLTALETKVDSLEEEIGGGTGGTGTLTARVEALEQADVTITGDIGSLQTSQTAQDTKISSLETQIGTAQSDIDTVEASVDTLSGVVGTRPAGDTQSVFAHIQSIENGQTSQNTAISTLQTTVGSASGGLVKDVNDNMGDIAALQADVAEIQTQQTAQDTAISGATTAANNAASAAAMKAGFIGTPGNYDIFGCQSTTSNGHYLSLAPDTIVTLTGNVTGKVYENTQVYVPSGSTITKCKFINCSIYCKGTTSTITFNNCQVLRSSYASAYQQPASPLALISCYWFGGVIYNDIDISGTTSTLQEIVALGTITGSNLSTTNCNNYPDSLNSIRAYTNPALTATMDTTNNGSIFVGNANVNIGSRAAMYASNRYSSAVLNQNLTGKSLVGMTFILSGDVTITNTKLIDCFFHEPEGTQGGNYNITFQQCEMFNVAIGYNRPPASCTFTGRCYISGCMCFSPTTISGSNHSIINSVFTQLTSAVAPSASNFGNYPDSLNAIKFPGGVDLPVSVANGGTGATTAAAAMDTLIGGLGSGTVNNNAKFPFSLGTGSAKYLSWNSMKVNLQPDDVKMVDYISSSRTITSSSNLPNKVNVANINATLTFSGSGTYVDYCFIGCLLNTTKFSGSFVHCTFEGCTFTIGTSNEPTMQSCTVTNCTLGQTANEAIVFKGDMHMCGNVVNCGFGTGSTANYTAVSNYFRDTPGSSATVTIGWGNVGASQAKSKFNTQT